MKEGKTKSVPCSSKTKAKTKEIKKTMVILNVESWSPKRQWLQLGGVSVCQGRDYRLGIALK